MFVQVIITLTSKVHQVTEVEALSWDLPLGNLTNLRNSKWTHEAEYWKNALQRCEEHHHGMKARALQSLDLVLEHVKQLLPKVDS